MIRKKAAAFDGARGRCLADGRLVLSAFPELEQVVDDVGAVALLRGHRRDELRHGLAVPGDDHGLAALHPVEQFPEMRFRLECAHSIHAPLLKHRDRARGVGGDSGGPAAECSRSMRPCFWRGRTA